MQAAARARGAESSPHISEPSSKDEKAAKTSADADTINISSDSDDDRRVRRTTSKTINYHAGGFFCDDEDLARITKRTGWLSGQGLAVFVRGELQKRGLDDISIVHPRMLLDVEMYGRAVVHGEGSVEACRAAIEKGLSEVCTRHVAACLLNGLL